MPDLPQHFLFTVWEMFLQPVFEQWRNRPRQADDCIAGKLRASFSARSQDLAVGAEGHAMHIVNVPAQDRPPAGYDPIDVPDNDARLERGQVVASPGVEARDQGAVGQQLFAGEATRLAYMTDEAVEGRDAFLEKRPPDWSRFPRYF